MDELRDRAHEALQRLGRRGRTTRIPDEVRDAVLAYAKRERVRGVTWARIAKEVGLSGSLLIRWAHGRNRRRARGKLVPVRLLAGSSVRSHDTATLITPSGYRVEGLSIAQALEMLRALG